MIQVSVARRESNLCLLLVMLVLPAVAQADAIFPSLFLLWPLTILLFIPVIWVEAAYSYRRLQLGFWESVRVVGVANVLSALAGLPIATAAAVGLQYLFEAVYFRDPENLKAQATQLHVIDPGKIRPHDTGTLLWLGLYPHWIMFVSAIVMVIICFFVSWWIEAKWIIRYLQKTRPSLLPEGFRIAKNANLLSYAFLTLMFLLLMVAVWPRSMVSMLSGK